MTDTSTPRPRIHSQDLVPVFMVRAMFGFAAACLAIVAFAVWTDRPLEATPPDSPVVAERLVHLYGEMSGAAHVLDTNGSLIAEFDTETGGFIAGMARVIERTRAQDRVPLNGPVRVVRTENGRLAIFDPSTGWSADLMGFGADNSAVFARLLN